LWPGRVHLGADEPAGAVAPHPIPGGKGVRLGSWPRAVPGAQVLVCHGCGAADQAGLDGCVAMLSEPLRSGCRVHGWPCTPGSVRGVEHAATPRPWATLAASRAGLPAWADGEWPTGPLVRHRSPRRVRCARRRRAGGPASCGQPFSWAASAWAHSRPPRCDPWGALHGSAPPRPWPLAGVWGAWNVVQVWRCVRRWKSCSGYRPPGESASAMAVASGSPCMACRRWRPWAPSEWRATPVRRSKRSWATRWGRSATTGA